MEEAFCSYVGFDVEALVASAQTITTLPQLHLRRWGKIPNLSLRRRAAMATLRDHVHRRSKTVKCFADTFKMTPQGALTSVNFDGADGAIPMRLLLGRNRAVVRHNVSGGASGNGEVFRLNSQQGYSTGAPLLAGSDGASPEAPLTLGPGGKYYGTTPLVEPTTRDGVQHNASGNLQISPQLQRCGEGQNPSAGLTRIRWRSSRRDLWNDL